MSVDEKPGMQAIERDGETLPMKPGKVERREFNSIRHSTQVLIANLHLGTGQLVAPTVRDTRTEVDFVAHIRQTVATDPEAEWVFLCDQLNTHQSESLVRYVAKAIGDTQDLGEKGKAGIPQEHADQAGVLDRQEPPYSLYLYAETLLVVESREVLSKRVIAAGM
jgi:DDE superfamily endonuclease